MLTACTVPRLAGGVSDPAFTTAGEDTSLIIAVVIAVVVVTTVGVVAVVVVVVDVGSEVMTVITGVAGETSSTCKQNATTYCF